MRKFNGLEIHYSRTVRRIIRNGSIVYAGKKYTSDELRTLPNGCEVRLTRFAEHPGEFDISRLLVSPIGAFQDYFWIKHEEQS